ncbi:MAG TPA: helix-turn-helix transcriptional regulator [Acidobacteriaceae bacterium]|nr:helix-turn-helix transcriptional regulator [Acidobacteriaceae bacterium]
MSIYVELWAMKLRLTPQTLLVLDAFLVDTEAWRYGYELSRGTGLKSGTLYPILMRMEERRLLETDWETNEPGRPPRHMYRLTPEGMQFARQQCQPAAIEPMARAAFERQN